MNANEIKIGYPLFKNGKIISTSVEDLVQIQQEESFEEASKTYRPIPLCPKGLDFFGFVPKTNNFDKNVHFHNEDSGIKVVDNKSFPEYTLNIKMTKKRGSGTMTYYSPLPYLHSLIDALNVMEHWYFKFSQEDIDCLEKMLNHKN
ncbi:hypothetical protein KIH41_17125 [Litoribacter ruber]|uniref:hypothetical protein n=1 Tax=Litoribacter ruber TaxID=702568 RepID=UPI001BD94471|nr:hypothetical protein [Litoribacter ruber]MBT0813013.1 hypothetical protein [Litoribacter ruber]